MLKDLINSYYRDSFETRERAYFYVSDVGKCPRALYFHFKDVSQEEPDPRILRVFDEGDYTHRRLMGVLFSLGVVQAVEISTPPNDLVHGRADGIITLENRAYVLEIKSSAGFKFRKLEKPRSRHRKQTQLYMHYLKVPRAVLLYENKNTQHLKEFRLEYDEELAGDLLDKFRFLKDQIEKDIVPEKPEEIKKWQCRHCAYRTHCRKLEK